MNTIQNFLFGLVVSDMVAMCGILGGCLDDVTAGLNRWSEALLIYSTIIWLISSSLGPANVRAVCKLFNSNNPGVNRIIQVRSPLAKQSLSPLLLSSHPTTTIKQLEISLLRFHTGN